MAALKTRTEETGVNSNEFSEFFIETDVLVLGAGAAGCGAALAAVREGAKVVLLDKGKLESCGCLGGGNDHFMAVLNSEKPFDKQEDMIKFFDKPLSGFNKRMLSQWFETMQIMVEYLLSIGVEFEKDEDGSWLRTGGFGQPGNWWINIANGQFIKRLIAKSLRKLGVDVLDHIMITKLLVEKNQITGAIGFKVTSGDVYVFKPQTVVLAMGNSANRATTNSTGNPYNTWHSPFNTGSQYALAYDAGVKIINTDILQQAQLIPKGFGSAGMHGINCAGAHEIDAFGNRFMGKYHPMKENGPRRNQILGTYLELVKGNGPPFHMDMRHCDPEEIKHLQNVLMPGDKATFTDYCQQKGIDFTQKPLEVELSELELGGMLLTDEHFSTNIQNLFNGCVFYAFSGSMCSGYLGGLAAAKAVKKTGKSKPLNTAVVQHEKEKVYKPFTLKKGMDYIEFETAIRQVMNYYMKFIRNEQGMKIALEKLNYIETFSEDLCARNLHELMRVHEAKILIKVCKLATLASLQRKESGRTIYNRSDYPELNPEYAKILCVSSENGETKIEWLENYSNTAG